MRSGCGTPTRVREARNASRRSACGATSLPVHTNVSLNVLTRTTSIRHMATTMRRKTRKKEQFCGPPQHPNNTFSHKTLPTICVVLDRHTQTLVRMGEAAEKSTRNKRKKPQQASSAALTQHVTHCAVYAGTNTIGQSLKPWQTPTTTTRNAKNIKNRPDHSTYDVLVCATHL
jgi:hypothetical protein